MPSYLGVAVARRGALEHVRSLEYGVLAVAAAYLKQGLLQALLVLEPGLLLLELLLARGVIGEEIELLALLRAAVPTLDEFYTAQENDGKVVNMSNSVKVVL